MAAIIEFEGLGENLLSTVKAVTDATIKLRDETSKAGEAVKKSALEGAAAEQRLATTVEGTATALQAVRKEAEKGGAGKLASDADKATKALAGMGQQGTSALGRVDSAAKQTASSVRGVGQAATATGRQSGGLGIFQRVLGGVQSASNGALGAIRGIGARVTGLVQGIRSSIPAIGSVGSAFQQVTGSIGGFAGSALSALGPIGLAVGAVAGGLLKVVSNTDAGATALDGLSRTGGIVFDKLTGKVTEFFGRMAQSDGVFARFASGLGEAAQFIVTKLTPVGILLEKIGAIDALKEAAEDGQRLAQVYDTLEDAQINLISSNAANERAINKLNIQLRDRTKSDAERLAIGEKIATLERQRADTESKVLSAKTAALRLQAAQELRDSGNRKEVSDATRLALAEAIAAEQAAAQQSEAITERAQNRVNVILDGAQEDADARLAKDRQRADQRRQIEDKLVLDIAAAQDALKKKLTEQSIEGADPRQRLDLQREAAIEEVRILERTLQEKLALQRIEAEVGAETFARLSEAQKKARADALIDGGQVELSVAQQEQVTSLELAVWDKYWEERKALDVQERTALLDLQQQGFEREREQFDIELDARVDKLREAGATIVQIEAFIQSERDKFRSGQVLKAIGEEEALAMARIDAQVRGAESEKVFRQRIELEKLATSEGFAQQRLAAIEGDTSAEAELLRAQLQGTINEIQAKRAELEANAPRLDLFDLLGIDITEGQKAQLIADLKSIGQSVLDFATSNIEAQQAVLDAQITTTDEVIADQQRRRDELQSQLDQALEDQKNGYANDADALRGAIQLTVEAENAALAEKKRIQAEQAKLARQQVLIDAAAQASALALSTANLIKSWSTIPFGIGLVSAFAQGLAIISTFSGIRNKIKAASTPQFHRGTKYVELGPNPRGRDTIPAYLDEGEAVVSAKNRKRFEPLVNAIVEGDMHKVQEAAIRELLGSSIQLDGDQVTKVVRLKEQYIERTTVVNNADNDRLRKDVKRLTGIVEAFMEQEGSRETTTGNVTKKRGKIIRKR